MTDDELPELHIINGTSYSIFTVRNNKVTLWYQGDSYERPLNNRATLETVLDEGAPVGNRYVYRILDQNSNIILEIYFEEDKINGSNDYNAFWFSDGGDDVL